MKDADEVRTLIKDIWDVRAAKLRKSVNKMINHDGGGGKPLTHVEVHIVPGSDDPHTYFLRLFGYLKGGSDQLTCTD